MPSTLTYSVLNRWNGGFIGNLALFGGESGLENWTISFGAGFLISNIWGAEIVSHTGTQYVLRSLPWNASVAAGTAINIGFQAAGEDAPAGIRLNDEPQGSDPAPQPEPEPPVIPSAITVAGGSTAEGNGGSAGISFVVSLDRPSDAVVTTAYATADGTALAGQDYIAADGTLRFAPGETSKTVTASILGDTVFEADETLRLELSDPLGATLSGWSATGTIVNDDVMPPEPEPEPLPTLSASDAEAVEGDPAGGSGGAASGFFHTEGNQIVDSAGNAVKIAGVNWFGLESGNLAPHGLWARGYKEMMDQMLSEGFNTIRLPFSSELLHTTAMPGGIDFSKNPDLSGLNGLQIMDKIIDYAGEIGLRVILDHHRGSAGAGTSGNGLWYGEGYTEAQWIADWTFLADRYAGDPTVIGADLHNEPYNGTWGDGSATDWAAAAERAGNAALAENPDWLIFVEGIGSYQGSHYWWGGNLMGVRDRPVQLDVADRVVYSAHDYPNSINGQDWFSGAGWEDRLVQKFDQMWGYIYKEGIAPVFIGEFGSKLSDPKDLVWLEKITAYLSGDFDTDGSIDIPAGDQGVSWTWWSWNPNSGDTGGILADDWTTVITAKTAWLDPLMYDLGEVGPVIAPGDANSLHFAVTLSAAAAQDVWVDYTTLAATADTLDFTPVSGTLHFAAGEMAKTVTVALTADSRVEGDKQFILQLSNLRGAEAGQLAGTGTIRDDDGTRTPPATEPPVAGPPPTEPPAAEAGLDGAYSLVNSWTGGFQGLVTVANHGPEAVNGWTLRIDTPDEITQIWNAEIVLRDAAGYVIRNAAWNGALGDEQETDFGFLGTGSGSVAGMELVFG